jgi:hypothetical protein
MRIAKISDKDKLDRSSVGVMGTSSSVECTVAWVGVWLTRWTGASRHCRSLGRRRVMAIPPRHSEAH